MQHPVVSQEEWLIARKALLAKEKEEGRVRDEVNAARAALPWVRIEKDYVFDTEAGRKSLSDLFDGRDQLLVYHFMLGPDSTEVVRAALSCVTISATPCPISTITVSPGPRYRGRHWL